MPSRLSLVVGWCTPSTAHLPQRTVARIAERVGALYGSNFTFLVEEGATLPSNLQGLYEVGFTGTTLDADATMQGSLDTRRSIG